MDFSAYVELAELALQTLRQPGWSAALAGLHEVRARDGALRAHEAGVMSGA